MPRTSLLSLDGRVALVTGAARGIGAATATALARAGARVAVLDRDGDGADRQANAIAKAGSKSMPLSVDVTDAQAVQGAVAEIVARWGRLDVLINNAGVVRDAQLVDVSDADWQLTQDVNLRGAFACTRAAAPGMIERGSGRILSATSIVARHGNFGQAAYAASKAGIVGLTRTWARELGPSGITANAVAPGFIDTEMVRSVPEKVIAGIVARTPAGRMGRSEEVAAVYLFLASDLAGYVNGAVLGVNGGLML